MSYLFGGTPFDGYDSGGRRSLNGGGGGGGQQQSTQTSYQTNIPEYLRAPAERMTARGETLSEQAYIPYEGARTAEFNPTQMQAFSDIAGLQAPSQFGQAGEAITGAQTFGTAGALEAMGYRPDMFSSSAAQQYMSPYQQAVTDIAKREATTEAQRLNTELGSKAAKAGAFGGSRFGIEQALLGSKLAQNLSDIQVRGSQAAFENAQQQFERDRAARLAGAKFGLEGAQFGADVGLKSASQLGQLGTAEQEANLKRIAAQQSAGAQQQALEQQKLDQAYQQFQEQRDWEKNQLGFLSGLIRGTPFSTSQLQTTSAPGATTASQLASIGLGAYGLSSLLGKKDGGAIKMAGGGSVEGYAYGGDISGYSDKQLQDAVEGKSDILPPDVAKQELNRRAKLRTAVQGIRAEEELAGGLGGLPAGNMVFADGGIVGYDNGGYVDPYEQYQTEMGLAPVSNFWTYSSDVEAQKKRKQGAEKATTTAAALKDKKGTAIPAAGIARSPRADAPKAAPVVSTPPTPAVSDTMTPLERQIMANMEATKAANATMAEEIAKGQQDVNAIRGDIKGIAALRAAAAIAQGGPGGTLAQLGRGLGVAGEEAQRGVNLMQSARQGLMGQRLQMAQLERAANAGDITALATLQQLRQEAPYKEAQTKQALAYADYLGRRDGGGAGSGLASTRLYAQQLDKAIKDFGVPTTAADRLRLADLKRQRDALLSQLTPGGGGSGISTLPKGAVVAND